MSTNIGVIMNFNLPEEELDEEELARLKKILEKNFLDPDEDDELIMDILAGEYLGG